MQSHVSKPSYDTGILEWLNKLEHLSCEIKDLVASVESRLENVATNQQFSTWVQSQSSIQEESKVSVLEISNSTRSTVEDLGNSLGVLLAKVEEVNDPVSKRYKLISFNSLFMHRANE